MKKVLLMITCIIMSLSMDPMEALAAPDWPEPASLQSVAGIVMDADTKTVLYGQNIHEKLYPASITKVLTALVVLENCSLDETVTFSKNAVYNVEEGSQSMGLNTGDQLSVKDCLYGLLLKSANETANALAEHVAGSTEAFTELMNQKAAELGCTESHFSNPSGLNDPNHYVTAYDMALITQAAFENETFCKIVSTTYYDIPPTSSYPEGQGISPGNKMIKPRAAEYDPDVIGGKTGYTSLAGNTLVICAKRGDMKLVTVVLNSNLKHYEDTRALLDFGFSNFQMLEVSDYDSSYTTAGSDLMISGLTTSRNSFITMDRDSRIVIPKGAVFADVTSEISYGLKSDSPPDVLAEVNYYYGQRAIGQCDLKMDNSPEYASALPIALITPSSKSFPVFQSETAEIVGESDVEETAGRSLLPSIHIPSIPTIVWKILLVLLLITAAVTVTVLLLHQQHKRELEAIQRRKEQRRQRLEESGLSQSEFESIVIRKKSERHQKSRRP